MPTEFFSHGNLRRADDPRMSAFLGLAEGLRVGDETGSFLPDEGDGLLHLVEEINALHRVHAIMQG